MIGTLERSYKFTLFEQLSKVSTWHLQAKAQPDMKIRLLQLDANSMHLPSHVHAVHGYKHGQVMQMSYDAAQLAESQHCGALLEHRCI